MSNTPQIRFAGFTDAWEQRKLGECFDERTERSADGELIAVTINSGVVKASELNRHDNSSEDKSNYKVVRVNDIAYNSMRMWQGASGYSQYDGILSPAYTVVIPRENVNPVFFSYMFKRTDMIHEFQINSQGLTSDTWNLKFPAFSTISANVPKSEEQQAIGNYFTNLDNLITLHQRKCDALQKFKKSMLQKMFPQNGESVPEIRFAGFTDAWEQRTLGELGEILTGSTPSTSHKEYYSDNGIPWVTPTDISENIIYDTPRKLSDRGQEMARIAPKGTILVTCIASIGKNTMLGTMGSFNQQINALIPNFEKNNPYFLLTESMLWSEKMKQQAAAGTMQIVNKTEFSELVTMVPKLEEQEAIGSYFKNLDHLITLHQRKLETLQKMKKSLLQKMFV